MSLIHHVKKTAPVVTRSSDLQTTSLVAITTDFLLEPTTIETRSFNSLYYYNITWSKLKKYMSLKQTINGRNDEADRIESNVTTRAKWPKLLNYHVVIQQLNTVVVFYIKSTLFR